jgi:hypothetical protein
MFQTFLAICFALMTAKKWVERAGDGDDDDDDDDDNK